MVSCDTHANNVVITITIGRRTAIQKIADWRQKLAYWRELVRMLPKALVLYPITRARRHRIRKPPQPYVHAAPSNLNFRYNDTERLPLTREPSWNDITAEVHTAWLSQSCLNRLPLEVRLIIWADVLGSHTIHLCFDLDRLVWPMQDDYDPESQKLRLIGNHCLESDPSTCQSYYAGCHMRGRTAARHELLSLLLVCKQM